MDLNSLANSFYFQLREVEIKAGSQPSSPLGAQTYWSPSELRDDFIIKDETDWLRWTGTQPTSLLHSLPGGSRINVHSQATLIWDPQRHSPLHVPYDCTTDEVLREKKKEVTRCWLPLTFEPPDEQVRKEHPRLWIVGTGLRDRCIDMPSNNIWEECLSPVYFTDGIHDANTSAPCDLAGNIAILYGLVAMTSPGPVHSSSFQRSLYPQGNSFTYIPTWARGVKATQCKPRYRGVIVKVGYRPEEYNSHEADQYERGYHGPILRVDTRYNNSERFPSQPAAFGAQNTSRSHPWQSRYAP